MSPHTRRKEDLLNAVQVSSASLDLLLGVRSIHCTCFLVFGVYVAAARLQHVHRRVVVVGAASLARTVVHVCPK